MLVYSAMAGNQSPPDYDLADRIALTSPSQVKAIGHPLRTTILSLLHERAATVTELAVAVERPKSTVAHHVKVLAEAGLVQVVRTRRVRAIEERFYGRTARMLLRRGRAEPGRGRNASGLQRLRGRRRRVGRGVPGREAMGLHPARPHLGGAGVGVLGADGGAGGLSSTSCRGRARPCTDSRSASIPPTIRRYRGAASKTLGWRASLGASPKARVISPGGRGRPARAPRPSSRRPAGAPKPGESSP